MRHKVVTAYRCAQAMSKLIQENRSGRLTEDQVAQLQRDDGRSWWTSGTDAKPPANAMDEVSAQTGPVLERPDAGSNSLSRSR
jgi:hypothetical protein